ncbi:MAG TPA: PilC/PilY family type IV pilus protein [Roseateles sp.]
MMFQPLRVFALLLAAVCALPAAAAPTEITQTPLIIANPDAVKANLLFILDDSGSMNFDFTPDHVNTALCRSTGATSTNSGNFANRCCIGGNSSAACYLNAAPFGTARGQAPFLAAGFNRQAYDPGVLYKPPVRADGTSWPSQTRAATSGWTAVKNDAYEVQNTSSIDLVSGYPDTEWCTNGYFTDCLRNDNYVLPGTVDGKAYTTFRAVTANGTGKVATGKPDAATTDSRSFGPHYYNVHAAEFCSTEDLRDCVPTAKAGYSIPAAVRWCNSDANARATTPAAYSCQATRNGTFSHARYPTKFFTQSVNAVTGVSSSLTFTINLSCSGSRKAGVASLKVGGVELLSGETGRYNSASSMASGIVAKVMANPDWTVTSNSASVTITAPLSSGNKNGTAVTLTRTADSNCGTFTPQPNAGTIAGYVAPVTGEPSKYGGRFERVDITPGTASAPNTFPKGANRSDCAGSVCTYDEEMTNFANWWTYYHSRMQAMKSSASLAFGEIGNNRRVGYMSINNQTGSDFLNLDTFETTHRSDWFTKLTAAKPGDSTPLRGALSKAGRLFAGSFNSGKINGVSVRDPVQYSCQRNAAILSTDGFWNESGTPKRPDGTTDIGDVDSDAAITRPQYDGNATSNTLADTAYFYRNTDLRTGTTNSANCTSGSGTNADVCGNEDTTNRKQTMMTFTIGLGVSGYMQFLSDSMNAPDFKAVANGVPADPGAGVCSWQTSGACNWPVPANNTLTAVDDLWHAAINGGGSYFSATSPAELYTGLSNTLKLFDAKDGAAAAATTSNPNVTSGDNQAFVSDFTSSQWTGQLTSKAIDLNTGRLDTVNWSAQTQLDSAGTRNIYMFSAGAANKLKAFNWAAMTTSEQAYFKKPATAASGTWLTQFCSGPSYCLTAAEQALGEGEALVDYLRGSRAQEGDLDNHDKYFRARVHLLGDIVNSEAVYVNKQLVRYADEGYAEFNARARTPMVYVGANDGMLHAFNATTGAEVWAFVPTAVLPNLYKLADKQYATKHQYFVDATPFVQDIKIGTEWRTILVGGLGAGGRAYYALDITDPAAPKALWEFSHDNLGLSFGQPEIGKLRDGTWVVILPSGYNNVSPGDGKGRLFVLDAATGQPVAGMPNGVVTTAGDTATPAGLAHIRGWVESATLDNTIQRVYAGDNLGNVWRFDINNVLGAPGYDAQLLGVLKDTDGHAQPVTSRPEVGLANNFAMVFVGTGRYLGESDLTDSKTQSIYAIKDALTSSGHGEVRAGGNFVKQTLVDKNAANESLTCPSGASWCTSGQTVRMSTSVNPVNLAVNGGWYVDLPLARERVNNDPLLVLGTLVVVSNVIEPGNLCKVGGSSWVNFFDYKTGAASSVLLGDVLSSRPTVYRLPNEKLVGLARDSAGGDRYFDPPVGPQVSATRRVSWRDLLQD